MLFRKVRVSHFDDKNRLYRVMYVPDDIVLEEFARIIMRTFRAVEGHLYEFSRGNRVYIRTEYADDMYEDAEDITGARLQDPGVTYKFVYDFGDWWEFEVRIYKKTQEMDTDRRVIVTEGKGTGIWEDNRSGYLDLLSGDFPADLSEDDEENDYYMPWNLNLEKASDTFADIDPEEETDYLNGAEYTVEQSPETIWREFNRLMSIAGDSFMFANADGSEWLDAYTEFKRVCDQLQAEGKLPDTFEKLCMEDDDFDGITLPEELADELPEYERYEELWRIMDELEQMFGPDGVTEFNIIRGKAEALKGMRRKQDVLTYVSEMYGKYPDNYFIKSLLLRAYRLNKKKKDGISFMDSVLKEEPECTEENYPFYVAASEFASYAGRKSLAARLKESIEREDQRQMDELDAELGDFYDDDMDIYEYVYTEELEDFANAVRKYEKTGDDADYREAMIGLTVLIDNGGLLFVPSANPDDSGMGFNLLLATDPQGDSYLPVFTETVDGLLPPDHFFISAPAVEILKDAVKAGIAGVVIDYHSQGNHSMIISTEQLDSYLNFLKEHGIDDDDDYDDYDDDFVMPS